MSLMSLSLGLVRVPWVFGEDQNLTYFSKTYIIVYYGEKHNRRNFPISADVGPFLCDIFVISCALQL